MHTAPQQLPGRLVYGRNKRHRKADRETRRLVDKQSDRQTTDRQTTWWRYCGRWLSSALCSNCSRQASKAGRAVGPVAEVGADMEVCPGVEEVEGPLAQVTRETDPLGAV